MTENYKGGGLNVNEIADCLYTAMSNFQHAILEDPTINVNLVHHIINKSFILRDELIKQFDNKLKEMYGS